MRFGIALIACTLAAGEFPRTLDAYAGKAPNLDGTISKGEYSDATRFTGVSDWIAQFTPTKDPKDLSVVGYVKHDDKYLYFAFDVTDDVLYGIDTERWLPDNNPRAHEISREGYPWFGDEMEILLNASNKWKDDENAAGNGFSWQMVCNLTKSQLHNTNVGGILAGEPRRSTDAWNTYVGWIEHGDQTCAVKPRRAAMYSNGASHSIPALKSSPAFSIRPRLATSR